MVSAMHHGDGDAEPLRSPARKVAGTGVSDDLSAANPDRLIAGSVHAGGRLNPA